MLTLVKYWTIIYTFRIYRIPVSCEYFTVAVIST